MLGSEPCREATRTWAAGTPSAKERTSAEERALAESTGALGRPNTSRVAGRDAHPGEATATAGEPATPADAAPRHPQQGSSTTMNCFGRWNSKPTAAANCAFSERISARSWSDPSARDSSARGAPRSVRIDFIERMAKSRDGKIPSFSLGSAVRGRTPQASPARPA